MSNKVWVRNPRNRELEADGFYISFNPSTDTGAETAIVKDGQYFILLGDWRKEYEELIDWGFAKCYDFFLSHEDSVSPWSEKL